MGAAFCPKDDHTNPPAILRALREGFITQGGTYLPNCTVDHIDAAPHDFTVHTAAELVRWVVIAAGPGSARLAPTVGLDMPVGPLHGEIMVTERMQPFLHHANAHGAANRGGSGDAGRQSRGSRTATSADVIQETRNPAALPKLAEATVVRAWAALDVMTPDGHPIYEQSKRVPGAFSAACHSGVTVAGAHALAPPPAILAAERLPDFEIFSPRRFDVQAARSHTRACSFDLRTS